MFDCFRWCFAGVCGVLLLAAQAVLRADDVEQAETVQAEGKLDPQGWVSFRNGNQQLGVATSELPEKLELLWKHPAPDGVASTAAIVDGRVYIGTFSGELLCLDLKTGESVWTYSTVDEEDANTFPPGFKASATVTADTVYIGDEEGTFHAVDRQTGKRKWTFETEAEIISSASVVGDRVLFGSYDNHLYCLNREDGTKLWQFLTDGYVHCTPAIAEKYTFIAGCDEHLRVIDIETGEQQHEMHMQSYLIATPSVLDDILYVGTYSAEVLAVDWRNLEVLWRYKDPQREFPYHASTAVTDDWVVIGGRDKQLHGIDRKTGEGKWTFQARARIDSSPVIVGNRVFVGSSDRHLYEIDLNTGRETWKHNIGQEITASPAVGHGCLVIGADSSNAAIYCFGAK